MSARLRAAAAAASLSLALAGCAQQPEPPRVPSWSRLLPDLDRAVLSIWGSGADDVYLVGGGLGQPGARALALRWDGERWHDLAPDTDDSIWWVYGLPGARPDIWMVGERGLVLRWDGERFTRLQSPVTEATLFGVWASGPDDVWIVGGLPGHGDVAENDLLLHWDGESLRRDDGPPRRGTALLKIWGSGDAPGDFWVVGERGGLWRRTAEGWQDHGGATDGVSTLSSVHGCNASEVYAAGSRVLLRFDGESWAPVGPPLGTTVTGVACGEQGLLVSGWGGLKLRWDRHADAWFDEQSVEPWDGDFHAAWSSPDGALWAVGGNYNQPAGEAPRTGVVAYFGVSPPGAAFNR